MNKERLFDLLQKEAEYKARMSKSDLKSDEREELASLQAKAFYDWS